MSVAKPETSRIFFRLTGSWEILAQAYISSQDDVFLYFDKFCLRSFQAENGVKFLPPTKLEKNRPSKG